MTAFETLVESSRVPILTAYYVTLGLLAIYGLHRFALLVLLARHRDGEESPEAPASWPHVTVQLPIYNELYVGPRLVEAVCELDYPRDRLEIQVLDDSDDETDAALGAVVESCVALGFDVRHLRRRRRTGFKAGALAAGLARARGELVAIFDADFVPPPDFLKRTVPHFADPEVGMVQARWGHLNRRSSWLTRAQAVLLDGHFLVEHAARAASGRFFNFNGTAGVWRRVAIEEAGGWQHDTLTEDLDLSYRAQLRGWRFRFLPDLVVPAELPADVAGFKSQQRRWARGAVQTARKLLPTILRSRAKPAVKLEAALHLTGNFCYTLLPILALLMFPAMYLRRGADRWQLLVFDTPLFVGATLSVLAFYLVSQRLAGGALRLHWLPVLGAMALGIGISLNNAGAVLQGLVRDGGEFVRTPKLRLDDATGTTRTAAAADSYRSRPGLTLPLETLFALHMTLGFTTALIVGMWWSLPFLWLFLQGYTLVAGAGITERLLEQRRRNRTLQLSQHPT